MIGNDDNINFCLIHCLDERTASSYITSMHPSKLTPVPYKKAQASEIYASVPFVQSAD